MARVYAGILGLLALTASLLDGLVHGRDPDQVLLAAWVSLLAFSAVGCVTGWIAARMVQESVEAAVAAELDRPAPTPPDAANTPAR